MTTNGISIPNRSFRLDFPGMEADQRVEEIQHPPPFFAAPKSTTARVHLRRLACDSAKLNNSLYIVNSVVNNGLDLNQAGRLCFIDFLLISSRSRIFHSYR